MHIPKVGLQTMMKDGAKHYSGMEEAVFKNITACKEISQIVRTSFGPNGMNKMIINHLDKLFVTNDAATIIRELEVQHPAAKMLIFASQQQEHEVGDGTNFVVILAGKLLDKAEVLLKMGLSTAEVIEGFERACAEALEVLPKLVCHTVKDYRNKEEVVFALKGAIASKQYGYEDFVSSLVVDACLTVTPKPESKVPFNVDNVRVAKIEGQGVQSSSVIRGMVFTKSANSTIQSVTKAKIAVFTADVDHTHTETKGTVLINNAAELKSFSIQEEKLLEDHIQGIKDAGVNVIVTSGKLGEMALHFINRMGLMALKVASKYDLQRLCRATKATALPRLVPPAPHEIGHCDEVAVEEIGDTSVTVFRQVDEDSRVATVVIRGSTANILDDIERAIDDGVNVYKAIATEQRFVPGAGATEIELARQLATFADKCVGLEQYAIKAFAEALEVVPFTLAENAGKKPKDVISRLYAAHEKGELNTGFDNEGEESDAVKDVLAAGILDNFKTKYWSLKYATQAAATVLRVDQIIMAKPAGGPKMKKNDMYDEDD